MQSIAILKLSAIGDTILTVPLVRCLQRHFPSVKITWIIGRGAYSLLSGLSDVEFIVIDKPRSLRDYWRFYQQMKSRSFDVLLALQTSLRANVMLPGIHAKQKIGFDAVRGREGHTFVTQEKIVFRPNHYVEGYLQFAEYLGAKDLSVEWNLPIGTEAETWAENWIQQHPGKWIAIHPATSQIEKKWPTENYIQLIQKILDHTEMNVVLTGGSGTTEISKKIAEAVIVRAHGDQNNSDWKRVVEWSGDQSLTLKKLGALFTKMHCVIAPDTGPLHLANALKVPVIGLYAVTNPRQAGPYDFQNLTVNCYPSSPAISFGKKMHRRNGMSQITPEMVFNKLMQECR